MSWVLSAFADEAGGKLDVQIKALQRAEFKYIDPRNVDGVSIVDMTVDAGKAAADKLGVAGIAVNMFGSPIGKLRLSDDVQIDLDRLKRLGDLKDVFGCNKVRFFSYYPAEKGTDPKDAGWRDEAISRIGKLLELASDLGMELYHENERGIFGDYVWQNALLRDEFKGKYDSFKMIFDFANYQHADEDCWSAWVEMRDATDAIHLKEARIRDGADDHVPVGEGDGKVSEILADAAERGFDGPLTLEPHLAHSAAVLATGPSGEANQDFSSMSTEDSFHVAAEAAKKQLAAVGKL